MKIVEAVNVKIPTTLITTAQYTLPASSFYQPAAQLQSTFHNDTSSIRHRSTCPVSTPLLNLSDGQRKWTYSQFDILCTGQSISSTYCTDK